MALLLKAEGDTEIMISGNKDYIKLDQLQKAVGGYIEQITLGEGLLFVNEEGRLKNLPHNPNASLMARRDIVGDAVFCLENEIEME